MLWEETANRRKAGQVFIAAKNQVNRPKSKAKGRREETAWLVIATSGASRPKPTGSEPITGGRSSLKTPPGSN